MRIGEEDALGQCAVFVAIVLPLGVADLMAVDAALDDVAFVIELGAVFAGKFGIVFRHGEVGSRAGLGGELRFTCRVCLVQGECAFEGFGEAGDGNVVGPVALVGAGAEAAIDSAVGVHEKNGERLVGVVLKEREVEAVGGNQAYTDEFFKERPESLVFIDEVVVELDALLTGDAAKDDDDWLASFHRFGETAIEVVVDPKAVGFDFGFVAADLLVAGLGNGVLGKEVGAKG